MSIKEVDPSHVDLQDNLMSRINKLALIGCLSTVAAVCIVSTGFVATHISKIISIFSPTNP